MQISFVGGPHRVTRLAVIDDGIENNLAVGLLREVHPYAQCKIGACQDLMQAPLRCGCLAAVFFHQSGVWFSEPTRRCLLQLFCFICSILAIFYRREQSKEQTKQSHRNKTIRIDPKMCTYSSLAEIMSWKCCQNNVTVVKRKVIHWTHVKGKIFNDGLSAPVGMRETCCLDVAHSVPTPRSFWVSLIPSPTVKRAPSSSDRVRSPTNKGRNSRTYQITAEILIEPPMNKNGIDPNFPPLDATVIARTHYDEFSDSAMAGLRSPGRRLIILRDHA
jgi:hypothetical protein